MIVDVIPATVARQEAIPYEMTSIQDRLAAETHVAPGLLWDHEHKVLLIYEPKGWRTTYEPVPAVHLFALQP